MKKFRPSAVTVDRVRQPAPKNTIPFSPGGLKIISQMYESRGEKFQYVISTRFRISNYGTDKAFRDWMFYHYSADIIQHDGKTMIRFIDEQKMLMFMLKHGV